MPANHLRVLFRYDGAAVLTMALFLTSTASFAIDGNEFTGLGPLQRGTAGAGVASPQDSTWMILNPAGLVELDGRFDTYLDILLPQRSFEPRGVPLIINPGAGRMTDNRIKVIPGMGAVLKLNEKIRLGTGNFVIGGTAVDYDKPRTTLGILFGRGDRRTEVQFFRFPFAYAHKLGNGWALGLTLNLNLTRLRSDGLTLRLRPSKADNSWDNAVGFGATLGIYKKWDKWSFGAAYTTRQTSGEFDEYGDLLRHDLDLPRKVQVGVAYRPIERLELLLDYKFVNWESVALFRKATIRGGLGWDDQHFVKAGAHYEINDRWTVRSGISYGEDPVGRGDTFSNALFPALSRINVGVGVSYAFDNGAQFHLSYLHSFKESQTDSGTGDLFSNLAFGSKASLEIDTFTIGFTLPLKRIERELPKDV